MVDYTHTQGGFPFDRHDELKVKVVRRYVDGTSLGHKEDGTRLFSSIDKAEDFIEQAERRGMEVRIYTANVVWERIQ